MTALEEVRAANVQTFVVLIVLAVLNAVVAILAFRRVLRHQTALHTLLSLVAMLVFHAAAYVANTRGAELFHANRLEEFEALRRAQVPLAARLGRRGDPFWPASCGSSSGSCFGFRGST